MSAGAKLFFITALVVVVLLAVYHGAFSPSPPPAESVALEFESAPPIERSTNVQEPVDSRSIASAPAAADPEPETEVDPRPTRSSADILAPPPGLPVAATAPPPAFVPATASEAGEATESETPQHATYIVRAGDTMSEIAQRELGAASAWRAIEKANPHVDPNRLRPGERLRIPTDIEESETGSVLYVVQSGDTLSKIARAYYNNAAEWRRILQANRAKLADRPNRLVVGETLRLPPPG